MTGMLAYCGSEAIISQTANPLPEGMLMSRMTNSGLTFMVPMRAWAASGERRTVNPICLQPQRQRLHDDRIVVGDEDGLLAAEDRPAFGAGLVLRIGRTARFSLVRPSEPVLLDVCRVGDSRGPRCHGGRRSGLFASTRGWDHVAAVLSSAAQIAEDRRHRQNRHGSDADNGCNRRQMGMGCPVTQVSAAAHR